MTATDHSTYTQHSRIRRLSDQQLWACRYLASSDNQVTHGARGDWTAVQDRDTIYVFDTTHSLEGDTMAIDINYVDARGDLLGWVHVDDDILDNPDNYLGPSSSYT